VRFLTAESRKLTRLVRSPVFEIPRRAPMLRFKLSGDAWAVVK